MGEVTLFFKLCRFFSAYGTLEVLLEFLLYEVLILARYCLPAVYLCVAGNRILAVYWRAADSHILAVHWLYTDSMPGSGYTSSILNTAAITLLAMFVLICFVLFFRSG